MEYDKVLVIDEETGDTTYQLISRTHQPVDIDRSRRPTTSRIRISTPRTRVARYVLVPKKIESPRQDATSVPGTGQGPKTRGDTNEFISAFWVKGKPKCKRGYRYDFTRKMCRLVR